MFIFIFNWIVINNDYIKKILFRANHRGTKEMDLVLGGFFSKNFNLLNKEELSQFETLLNFSDKRLTDFFVMNKKDNDLEQINLVKKIKNFIINKQ
mgnify:CR=1 FL=1|tara:strand:- start:92 stop:379 length:288 start_codon:yes stop_codon:yes gene_type:complete